MYKVFFNDRTIFLTDEFTKNFQVKYGLFYKYRNTEDLKDLISFYNRLKKIDSLYIFHYDIEFLRDEFKSCFTNINAAGGLIKNDKEEFLFMMRRGKWDLPKGKLDDNETFEMAAVREAKEECGLDGLSIVSPMLSTYHTYPLDNSLVLKKTYWYKMKYSGNALPVPQTEEDITEIRWLKREDVAIVKENTYKTILDVLKFANLINL